MKKFKKGDIVARISYNKDILFEITKIIKASNDKEIMLLKGITERIEADSPSEDLEIVDKRTVDAEIKEVEAKIASRITQCLQKHPYFFSFGKKKSAFIKNEKRSIKQTYTGRILHLDAVSDLVENRELCMIFILLKS